MFQNVLENAQEHIGKLRIALELFGMVRNLQGNSEKQSKAEEHLGNQMNVLEQIEKLKSS